MAVFQVITFHKIVALTAGVFAVIHSVGHCVNFYHVATQNQEGLACLFQEAVFGWALFPFSFSDGFDHIIARHLLNSMYKGQTIQYSDPTFCLR